MIEKPVWARVGVQWSAGSRTVLELVQHACERFPDSPAMIVEDGLVVTYARLLDQAELTRRPARTASR